MAGSFASCTARLGAISASPVFTMAARTTDSVRHTYTAFSTWGFFPQYPSYRSRIISFPASHLTNLYGPVPTGFRLHLPMGVLGEVMVTTPIRTGKMGSGTDVLTSRVWLSITVGVIVKCSRNLNRTSHSMLLSIRRLMEYFAASALKSAPSWNLTPLRRVNCQVVGSICFHEVASLGTRLPSLGLISVNGSTIFFNTTRPTADRQELQDSTLSGSSARTILTVFSGDAAPTGPA